MMQKSISKAAARSAAILLMILAGAASAQGDDQPEAQSSPKEGCCDWRIEGLGGFSALVGDIGSGLEEKNGANQVKITQFAGGSGPAFGAQAWVDGLWSENLSLGLGYIGTTTTSDTQFRVKNSGSTILQFSDGLDLDINLFLVNAAFRTRKGPWHPVLGAGIGGGWVDVKAKVNDVLLGTRYKQSFKDTAPHFGVQAFVGVDYDITDWMYVGVSGRMYYINADLGQNRFEVLTLLSTVNLGFEF